jgi:alpha-tubulin suppressor-like RCC1 family protein
MSKVCCGGGHTLMLTEEGGVYSCGRGLNGRCGNETDHNQAVPRPVNALVGRLAGDIACGWRHSLVLMRTGEVYSFGCNTDGQLGVDTTASATHSAPPRTIVGGKKVKRSELPALADSSSPLLLGALRAQTIALRDPVVSIHAGFCHSIARTAAGKLFTWGWGRCVVRCLCVCVFLFVGLYVCRLAGLFACLCFVLKNNATGKRARVLQRNTHTHTLSLSLTSSLSLSLS